ncbi:MAG: hypothetical protein QM644_10880 [Mobilitalea sp.]
MSVNGITGATQSYDTKSSSKATAKEIASEVRNEEAVETAAVYEKSETATKNKIYKRDSATIDRLVEEANKRTQSLRDLVQKMLMKQGQTFDESTDIYSLLREGKVEVDPETRAQAQKDIAEDGYWGVEQTSDRLVSFAKALSGGDPSKADEMIKAVQKGFEEATKAWGGELPDISKRTLEATIKKMETWRDELTN